MDNKWPPVKECPQYKYGMISQYLNKFVLEYKEHIDDSEYCCSDDEDGYIVKNAHQIVKKFLKQVRESRGYDVDCRPPDGFNSPFTRVNVERELVSCEKFGNRVRKAADFVIEKLNEKSGKTYKLEKIEKLVDTHNMMFLFTIKARAVEADAAVETFHAMVYAPPGLDHSFELEELRLKPEYDAPTD